MPNRITAANIKSKLLGRMSIRTISPALRSLGPQSMNMADIYLSNFGDAGGSGGGADGGGLAGMLSGLFDRVGSGVPPAASSASFRLGDDLEVLMGLEGEALAGLQGPGLGLAAGL